MDSKYGGDALVLMYLPAECAQVQNCLHVQVNARAYLLDVAASKGPLVFDSACLQHINWHLCVKS
jgi:hypothetical protein